MGRQCRTLLSYYATLRAAGRWAWHSPIWAGSRNSLYCGRGHGTSLQRCPGLIHFYRTILCCLSEGLQYLPAKKLWWCKSYTSKHPKGKSLCQHHSEMEELFTRASSSSGGAAQIHIYLQSFRALSAALFCSSQNYSECVPLSVAPMS